MRWTEHAACMEDVYAKVWYKKPEGKRPPNLLRKIILIEIMKEYNGTVGKDGFIWLKTGFNSGLLRVQQ